MLAPIFALWFGLGIWSKVALGFTLVFFIVFFNVYQGVREVPPVVLANARMLGMNERQLLRHVYWPAALTWMFSSLHTSVGFALVGAVVGEYLGSSAGLGYKIQQAESVFDVTGVFAGMLILAVFVIVIDSCVTRDREPPPRLAPGPTTGRRADRGPLSLDVRLRASHKPASKTGRNAHGTPHISDRRRRGRARRRLMPRPRPQRGRRAGEGRSCCSASAASRCSTTCR